MFRSGGVEQYQIVQNCIEELEVKIIKNQHYTQDTELVLKNQLQECVGSNVVLTFEYVNEIEVPKSGKRRYIISNIGL